MGLAAAALFGAATPSSKVLLVSLSAFQLAGLLYLGGAAGVIPLLLRKKDLAAPWHFTKNTRVRLLGAVFFGGCLGPVFLLLGLRIASSSSVALWLNLELFATALLGQIFFRDRLTRTAAVSVALTLTAATLLSASEGDAGIRAGVLVLLACLCWGIDNHLTALIDGISPAETTFWKSIAAGMVNFMIGIWAAPLHAPAMVVGLAVVVGVLAYGISIVLYIASAQQLGAIRSQIVFSSSPFFGVLFSTLFLGESLSLLQVSAMVLFAIALGLLALEQHVHEHRHEASEHFHRHHSKDRHHAHEHGSGVASGWHSHWHVHEERVHSHFHWPDLHHRHTHE